MAYTVEHAGALADLRAAGVAVTFTLTGGTYAPSTDVETAPTSSTVTGYAIRTKGQTSNASGSLVQAVAITLLFAPDTYGERPEVGATVAWEGATYTVVTVQPVAPDGADIISRVGLA